MLPMFSNLPIYIGIINIFIDNKINYIGLAHTALLSQRKVSVRTLILLDTDEPLNVICNVSKLLKFVMFLQMIPMVPISHEKF